MVIYENSMVLERYTEIFRSPCLELILIPLEKICILLYKYMVYIYTNIYIYMNKKVLPLKYSCKIFYRSDIIIKIFFEKTLLLIVESNT